MKVLIVDDEPLVRLSLARALRKRGHEVFEAEDGERGMVEWRDTSPQLVFLDVLMPRLSGPDLLRAIGVRERRAAKVILMSAFTGEYDLDKAKSLGADLFIPKPFEDVFRVVEAGEELFGSRKKD